MNNLWQKLLALCMALVIWIMAPTPNREGLTEIQLFAPVSYINLPKNLEIVSQPIASVSLFVSIPHNEVGKINPSQFQLQVDLSGAEPGENNFALRRSDVLAPKQVTISKIQPSSLDLTLEERVEKLLPIKPVFKGELGDGYVIEKAEVTPAEIIVHGPQSILDGLDQIETKALDIQGLNSQVDMVVFPIFPQGVGVSDPKPELYTIRIEIGSEPMSINFEKIPIGLVNQLYVTKINPKWFNVQLRGPRKVVERLNKDDIQAFINLQPLAPGTHKIKAPTLRVPAGVQVLKTWPPIDVWILNQKLYE